MMAQDLLAALVTILAVSQFLGWLFCCLGQPPVLGEIIGGLLLGPSFLGRLAPAAANYLLPPAITPLLGVLAQLGVILYMFLVGLELDPGLLRQRARSALVISQAGIVVPFLLGTALAVLLYPRLSSGDVPFTSFALFLGVALSVTAFPVLARILTDRGLQKTQLGVLALTCAAANDVTAWCLLAFVAGVAGAHVRGPILVTLLTVAFIGLMIAVVRPLAARFLSHFEKTPLSRGGMALVLGAVLLSALATESIGIHAIFGAFLLGAVVPHDSTAGRAVAHKLEDVVTVLLLPVYFAFTGLRTEVGLVSGLDSWLLCGLIILTATAGKFGGTLAAARLTGLLWRDGAALGVLMNTRGLMELVVLNVGLDLGIISPTLFAMMVLMAVATTLPTAFILGYLIQEAPSAPARL
jgi:Kef-type K+ transport system membrane component KefB